MSENIAAHQAAHKEILIAASPSIIADAFEKFLRLSVGDGDASPKTLQLYRQGFTSYLVWCKENNVDPLTADSSAVEGYRRALTGTLKPATVALRLVAVRILYRALVRWGRRQDDPAAGIKAPRQRTGAADAVLQKAIDPSQVPTLLAAFPSGENPVGARNRAVLALLLFQGLRAAEVCALTMKDTDHALTWLDVLGKGRKKRRLYLSGQSRAALMLWLNRRGPGSADSPIFLALEAQGQAPLLADAPRALNPRTIERIADSCLRRAGLKAKGRSAHAFRHTFAILARLGGAAIEGVADDLGHASIATTQVYTRAAGRYQESAAGKVADLIERLQRPSAA